MFDEYDFRDLYEEDISDSPEVDQLLTFLNWNRQNHLGKSVLWEAIGEVYKDPKYSDIFNEISLCADEHGELPAGWTKYEFGFVLALQVLLQRHFPEVYEELAACDFNKSKLLLACILAERIKGFSDFAAERKYKRESLKLELAQQKH